MNLLEFASLEGTLRKEQLVHVAQCVCQPQLLPDVEGLLVSQIALATSDARIVGIPGLDGGPNDAQRAWLLTSLDPRRTVQFPPDSARVIARMQERFRMIHLTASRGVPIDSLVSMDELLGADPDACIDRRLAELKARSPERSKALGRGEIAPLVAIMVLAAALTPFPLAIEKMWQCLAISDSTERVEYLQDLPQAIWLEGPLGMLVAAITWQSRRKYDRGSWFDAYHLEYLQLPVDFYTLDRELLGFCRSCPPESRLSSKTHDASGLVRDLQNEVEGSRRRRQ